MRKNTPIRLLHLADLHLGELPHNPPAGYHHRQSRFHDLLATLDSACDLAIKLPVDALLLAGDTFNSPYPTPLHLRELALRLRRLLDVGIAVVAIPGNHDSAPRLGKASALEVFSALQVPGFHYAPSPKVLELQLPEPRGKLHVLALPWPSRLWLADRQAKTGELADALRKHLKSEIARLISQIPQNAPAILLAHLSLAGSTFPNQTPVNVGSEVYFPREDLLPPPLIYGALGHQHRHQSFTAGGGKPLVYAGSPAALSFAEGEDAKGGVLVTIAENGAEWEFVPLPGRPLHRLAVDLRGAGNPQAILQKTLSSVKLDQAILGLKVQIGDGEESLDWNKLREIVESAGVYHFTGFEVIREQSASSHPSTLNPRQSPLSALAEYCASHPQLKARQKVILELAEELLHRLAGERAGGGGR
jgi:exonuclease SbcD